MAAPTPVSALVHSSTLVTAGVYLLIRFNSLFFRSGFNHLITIIGVLTIVMAGFSANIEIDMKKIIALSTLSQLGVIFFSLGLGQPLLSFIHLISHAYFKAMIFMAAGSLIHRLKEYQDIRKIGSLALLSPLISSVLLVASLRLCGLPFIRGFFSKDLILEHIMCRNINIIALILAIVATFITITYSARVVLKIHFFFSKREPISIESDAYNSLC